MWKGMGETQVKAAFSPVFFRSQNSLFKREGGFVLFVTIAQEMKKQCGNTSVLLYGIRQCCSPIAETEKKGGACKMVFW